ncbi:DEAD/DEAH box helicase [Candidatus Parcubacteria bacterium]|nr:DEAD/DEAH box helicase [Candidatus Parcubacteria bacterium]
MIQSKQTDDCFCDLGLNQKLLAILEQKGFAIPTPIQSQVIPMALEGKDVIGIAQTGTGKTLAFALPIIQHLTQNMGQCLIMVPTRELALQVEKEFLSFGRSLGLHCVAVIGGVSQHAQVRALKNNPQVVIATPGRLADLMKQGHYRLNNVKIIILDEADRMLDIGFLPEIKHILQTAPKEKQTMLFSATMSREITTIAVNFMKMPQRIEVSPQGTAPQTVEHEVFIIRKSEKVRLLDSLLQTYQEETTLIFSRTKHGAKKIARDVRFMGHTATEIHGNRSQVQRKAALDGFSEGKFRVMIATDIASRGIDVKDITLVINFDMPDDLESYVHRIGRTGRAGKSGKAISFVLPEQRSELRKVERLIKQALPVSALPALPPEREQPPYKEPRQRQTSFKRRPAYRAGRPAFQRNSQRGYRRNFAR